MGVVRGTLFSSLSDGAVEGLKRRRTYLNCRPAIIILPRLLISLCVFDGWRLRRISCSRLRLGIQRLRARR